MSLFRGRAFIKIDLKGRLSLPAVFREASSKSKKFYVTNSRYQGHNFLDLHTSEEWAKLEKKIAQLPSLKSEVMAFQRFYLSSGELCEIDKQSRLLLPQHLREYAGLKEDIVLVGMGTKIEVWNQKTWNELFAQLESDFERVMATLSAIDEEKGRAK